MIELSLTSSAQPVVAVAFLLAASRYALSMAHAPVFATDLGRAFLYLSIYLSICPALQACRTDDFDFDIARLWYPRFVFRPKPRCASTWSC